MKRRAANSLWAVLIRTMELPFFSMDTSGCSKQTSTPASWSRSLKVD